MERKEGVVLAYFGGNKVLMEKKEGRQDVPGGIRSIQGQ